MTRLQRQKGYLLLPVMMAISLLAVIAYMMNYQSALEADNLGGERESDRARYLAEAGLNHARWAVANKGCNAGSASTTFNLPPHNYTLSISTLDTAATTTQYNFAPDRDAYIDDSQADTNFGSATELPVTGQPGATGRRGVIHFDLSSITDGDRVASATARFYLTGVASVSPIHIHRIDADWSEADATWNSLATAFEPEAYGRISPQSGAGVWVSLNLTALAQSWVNDPTANHGIMLIGAEDSLATQFSSREYGTVGQRPYLEVTTASGEVSPVKISATGTLAPDSQGNNLVRTLTRSAVPAVQPPVTVSYQLGIDAGGDAMLDSSFNTRNHGNGYSGISTNQYQIRRNLMRFALPDIPPGATIQSARLELYKMGIGTLSPDAAVSLHRVTRAWVEGTKAGGGIADGATWDTHDGINPWTDPGGDFDITPIASAAITPVSGEWVGWEIAPLVTGWTSGRYENHGLLLQGRGNLWLELVPKEASNSYLDRRPRLTITYACVCGSPCLALRGSGKVLLVVSGGGGTPSPAEALLKAQFESWGYTVNTIGENSSITSYNNDISDNDVAYIPAGVDQTNLGSKLTEATIGVVSEQGGLNDELGIAASSAWQVGSSINISDNSHYITALFPIGALEIYSADMEGVTVSGNEASGLQTLADWGGAGSLVVLETGAVENADGAYIGDGTASGRRVMLPLGRSGRFNWHYLNNNGLLMVQRALQWGMGSGAAAPANNLLFVSAGSTAVQMPSGATLVFPTAQEQLRIDLIESWGYSVSLISQNDSQANYDTALDASNVAYIPSTVNAVTLGTKPLNASIGVVNEVMPLAETFGFDQGYSTKSRDQIRVLDNTHYITSPLATGYQTLFTSLQTTYLGNHGTSQSGDVSILADVFNTGSDSQNKPSLMTLSAGDVLEMGGSTAAGRRVQLPWGDNIFDPAALNANGETVMQRAIEWAEGAGSDPVPAIGLLMVVGDDTTLSSKDLGRKTLMESWGYTVTLIDDGETQASFDTAAAAADVVYVSGTIGGGALADKLTDSPAPVVNEFPGKLDNFGFSQGTGLTAIASTFIKTDPDHYITSPLGGSSSIVFTTSLAMSIASSTLAPDLQYLATVSGQPSLVALETGATRWDGNPAAARRVHLPFASAETTQLTADGQILMQRAIEWAAGAGGSGGGGDPPPVEPSCDGTFRDEFNAEVWSGSDGTLSWSTNWLEWGEGGTATGGDIMVMDDQGPFAARVRDNGTSSSGAGIRREADLSAYATATLSFDYRRNGPDNADDYVTVDVSNNGGSSWSELDRFIGESINTEDPNYVSVSYDISGYISANTQIRFLSSSDFGNQDIVYFDNVEICVDN